MNRNVIFVVIGAVLLLAALVLLRSSLMRRAGSPRTSTYVIGTAVVGAPLKWRVLDTRLMLPENTPLPHNSVGRDIADAFSGTLGGLLAGNFDADQDQELVLIGNRSSRLYEADGTSRPVKLHGGGFMMNLTAWDYDGDVIDEVVPEAIGYSVAVNYKPGSKSPPQVPTTTPVFNLDGRQVAKLQGIGELHPLEGDIDGDGHPDLAFGGMGSSLKIYGVGGKTLPTVPALRLSTFVAIADPLGAGHASLIQARDRARELVLLDSAGAGEKTLGRLGFVCLFTTAADLDGDRHDELLFGAEGYFSAVKGFIPFQYKNALMPATCKCAAGDFMGSGAKQVAVLEGQIPVADELVIYDVTGKVVRQEKLAGGIRDGVWEVAGIHSGGKDYLCIQLSDKLLIYP
jgi:hypothetical protein